jgi:hypothetical protein
MFVVSQINLAKTSEIKYYFLKFQMYILKKGFHLINSISE